MTLQENLKTLIAEWRRRAADDANDYYASQHGSFGICADELEQALKTDHDELVEEIKERPPWQDV